MKKVKPDRKTREIEEAMKNFPKEVRRQEREYGEYLKLKKSFGRLNLSTKNQVAGRSGGLQTPTDKVHPWRICPKNQFFRSKHAQSSYVRQDGTAVQASLHPDECVINETGKDQLYAAEIQKIADLHFNTLTKLPTAHVLKKYANESDFDHLIAGWTKYWNEVLRPKEPLENNFVKALICTESGFDVEASNGKKGKKRARGLMQVTDESVNLMAWGQKELKDHFVNLTEDDMLNPNLTICAGLRWLFRKREIAESRSKKITWRKVVMLYKNYKSMSDPQMKKFIKIYESLNTGEK